MLMMIAISVGSRAYSSQSNLPGRAGTSVRSLAGVICLDKATNCANFPIRLVA
jgi:hypothetical protein